MKKEDFVKELKQLTPPAESFVKLGYSPELVQNNIKSYECVPVDISRNQTYFNSELIDLITYYDCSNVQVGVLTFERKFEETESYYLIGKVETDVLAISKITLEMVVLDHLNLEWIIWPCAANGEDFLDAILAAAECITRCIEDTRLAYDPSFKLTYVLQCAQKAGGDKYADFYKMLLGYDE